MRDSRGKNQTANDELQTLAKQENLPLHIVDLDVTSSDSVDAAIAHVLSDGGRLDVLVNNAGHMSIGIAEAFTEEQVRQQTEVDFFARCSCVGRSSLTCANGSPA